MTNNIKKKDIKNLYNILYLNSIIDDCQGVYSIVDIVCINNEKKSEYIIKDIILIMKMIKNGFKFSTFIDIDTLCDLKIRNGKKNLSN